VPDRNHQSPPTDQTPQPFGPFVLERRIAVGGTAEVFHARPRQGQRPASQLVIKRLLTEKAGGDHFVALNREAELNQAIKHHNVVTVFGAGMVGDEPYLAMEFVDGVDLHRLLKLSASENKPLPPSLAVYIVWSVANALTAVHSACGAGGDQLNITHGDVSPSNIYLSLDGEVKLGDFGVAHCATPEARKAESLKGKFGYLAPEQLLGDAIDHRADLFALGVVMGEMLIGKKIFPGNGQLATLLSIREVNIEPLRRAADSLPRTLYEACTRALEKSPDDRFVNAAEFAASLESLCDKEQAQAVLAEWVAWARDANVFARQFEQRLRSASGANWAERGSEASDLVMVDTSSVRRGSVLVHEHVSFSRLLELAATGYLRLDDQVSLMGEDFRPVEQIDELSRYLMPSTATTTAELFQPGIPDFTGQLAETPMLQVLARMRQRCESGALFVTRQNRRGLPDRKDIYLNAGRLLHVASSDREELLGQYALRRELITQEQLEIALGNIHSFGGRLGDTLIGMGMAEPTAVFRAIRNQGRDRVAALCAWKEGRVQLYRGSEAGQIQFRLDIDLTVPMMAGAMLMLRQGQDPLKNAVRLYPGRRFDDTQRGDELAGSPVSLTRIPKLISAGVSIDSLVASLREVTEGGRPVSELEARAGVTVAAALDWLRIE
jgi:serine/threonine-protein kinase